MEINLTSFQEGIKDWISEIRRQRFETLFVNSQNIQERKTLIGPLLKHHCLLRSKNKNLNVFSVNFNLQQSLLY